MLNLINKIEAAYLTYNSTVFPFIFVWIAVVWLLVKGKRHHIVKGILGLLVPEILCGYVAAEYAIPDNRAQKKRTFIFLVFIIILLQLGIGLRYTDEHFNMISNLTKTDDEVIQIVQTIKDNDCVTEKNESEIIRMMAPRKVASAVREYDSTITLLHGDRFGYSPWSSDQLMLEAEVYECNCLVVEQAYDFEERFLEEGFAKSFVTEHYVIYMR